MLSEIFLYFFHLLFKSPKALMTVINLTGDCLTLDIQTSGFSHLCLWGVKEHTQAC